MSSPPSEIEQQRKGSKDAATHCPSWSPHGALRRDQIASDREDREPEAYERVRNTRGPAREVTVVQARDIVPHAEARLRRLDTGHAARLAVDDHGADRRLDANGAEIVGDQRSDPGPGQRRRGTRGDHAETVQTGAAARGQGAGPRWPEHAAEREETAGEPDDDPESQRPPADETMHASAPRAFRRHASADAAPATHRRPTEPESGQAFDQEPHAEEPDDERTEAASVKARVQRAHGDHERA